MHENLPFWVTLAFITSIVILLARVLWELVRAERRTRKECKDSLADDASSRASQLLK